MYSNVLFVNILVCPKIFPKLRIQPKSPPQIRYYVAVLAPEKKWLGASATQVLTVREGKE